MARPGEADDARSRIMASAVKLFAQRGFAAASTREIADGAGVTKPMIYYYFGDKNGLYASIVRDLMERLTGALAADVPAEGDTSAAIRSFVRSYLRFFQTDRPLISVIFREMFGLAENLMCEIMPVYFHRIVTQLRDLIERGMREGVLRPADAERTALSLLGIANIFVIRYLLLDEPYDVAAVEREAVDVYLGALAPER